MSSTKDRDLQKGLGGRQERTDEGVGARQNGGGPPFSPPGFGPMFVVPQVAPSPPPQVVPGQKK